MLASESQIDDQPLYPSAQIPLPSEHDPFVIGLKQRLPEALRDSFTPEQIDGLRNAFATRSWARHKVDVRGTFSLWSNQYYFVLVGGRNKRNLSRAQRSLSLGAKAVVLTVILFAFVSVGLVGLYLVKSALGIDLLPNHSFGLWDWFKGQ